MVKDFTELDVWKKAVDLIDAIYDLTEAFPKSQTYGLSAQLQRSAVSVASNIAEGSGRVGTAEFIQFLKIAKGSLAELRTQNVIALRRQYVSQEQFTGLEREAISIDKMIHGLIMALKRK